MSPRTPLVCFIFSPLIHKLIRQMQGTLTLIDMVSKRFTMNWLRAREYIKMTWFDFKYWR